MNNSIESVKEFHRVFSQPIKETIGVPSKERAILRVRLIFEELMELAEASGVGAEFNLLLIKSMKLNDSSFSKESNNAEALDALVDLQYVLDGTILEYGMDKVFEQAHNNVHASNMTKFCTTKEELQLSLDHFKEKDIQVYTRETNGVYFIYKAEDSKLLKPLNYVSADMEKIITDFKVK